MKKKLLAVLMTGIMAMSFAATTTAVYAKGDDDNTLTVWAWDQNFNIKAMNIAGEQYAKDHEGFKVDVVETSSVYTAGSSFPSAENQLPFLPS